MEGLSKKPTNEILNEMTRIEKQIDLLIMKYNLLNAEMIKRFPFLNGQSEFENKELKKELK